MVKNHSLKSVLIKIWHVLIFVQKWLSFEYSLIAVSLLFVNHNVNIGISLFPVTILCVQWFV